MDGFAIRAADTASAAEGDPVTLQVAGESRAGSPAERPLEPGEAFRISTGAVVPEGADAILRQEDAKVGGDSEEHTSELQSPCNLVCRLLLEKKNTPLSSA